MSTERQIESNRENAKHSTGPVSAEGKAVSSRNHTRHSLTARGLIILPAQKDDFADLEAGLRARLNPSGELQESIFARVLESNWNLYRCQFAEAQINSESGIDPLLDVPNAARYDRIQKYSRQYENSIYKALRVLADLQTDAEFRLHIAPEEPLSDACCYQKVMSGVPQKKSTTVDRYLESLMSRHQSGSNWKPASEDSIGSPAPSPSTAKSS
jgi:hypothetical protein